MSKMKSVVMVLMLSVAWVSGAGLAQAKTPVSREKVVRIVVINMSGKAREARVRDAVVVLPVAQRVALEVPVGARIKITSDADRAVGLVITAAATDEGRTIPIS